jgi:hypothetical protein
MRGCFCVGHPKGYFRPSDCSNSLYFQSSSIQASALLCRWDSCTSARFCGYLALKQANSPIKYSVDPLNIDPTLSAASVIKGAALLLTSNENKAFALWLEGLEGLSVLSFCLL